MLFSKMGEDKGSVQSAEVCVIPMPNTDIFACCMTAPQCDEHIINPKQLQKSFCIVYFTGLLNPVYGTEFSCL
jgi:hypothetical protein